jgi:serine/threonine protein kinase/DNA-binding beta-propeller fold protein YncE
VTEQTPGPSGETSNSGESGGPRDFGGPRHFGSDSEPAAPPELVSSQFRVGSQVAGYRLDEQIGHGGMAVVFRAYDSRLDRHVALKILAPALAEDEAFRRRFIRESRAAAAVDDPHIIPVFEAGEANGVLFIAMRYVRGGDVRRLIDQAGPLPLARVAEIVRQAANALDAAHARGLVHRDVKPGNMLLEASAADEPEHVYLSDFGLSKTSLAVSGLTATGQFLGTLDYVAPEQIEGRAVDGRSDQYALACSAYEMLCGEPPFRREQSVSVMYAHLSEPPPPLRLRRPELPAGIDDVLAKALAKAPGDRYLTCREFSAALRVAAGLSARQDSPPAGHPVTEISRPVTSAPAIPGAGAPLTEPAGVAAATRAGLTDPGGGDLVPGRASGEPDRAQLRRPWWRAPVPIASVCVVALLAGGGAFFLTRHGPSGSAGNAIVLSAPGCTTAVAKAPALSGVSMAVTPLSGSPFGAAVTPDGQYSFVTLGNAVAVLRNNSSAAPTQVGTIDVPQAGKGDAVTHDGRYLLAAAGSGAAVISIAAAVQGAADPVVGSLTSPHGSGAVEVLIAPNDGYAFVTLQSSAEMAVFNLKLGLAQGFSAADFVGYVPLAKQPVGMSTDGTWLYVASIQGVLSVVSMSRAETDPAQAVVSTVRAGCGAARTLMSDHHKIVWVTARQSDALLAFSAAKLRTDPKQALLARVMVGETPVGEALVDGGARIVVADANLNNLASASSNLAIISTSRALSGKPALLGYLPTGQLPRQFAVEPGGRTLLVTVQNAHELAAISVADLP